MKAVIFDMDGVLFDTEKMAMDAWEQVAQEQGIRGMKAVAYRCIGLNHTDAGRVVRDSYGEDFPFEDFRNEVSVWMAQHIEQDGLPVKPGVVELLEYLKQSGIAIGLASSTRQVSVLSHLTRAGIREYFQEVVSGDMVKHSKPQPDIYLLACSRLGAEPEECCAVEDSPNGVRSADAAGMQVIMVPDLIAPDDEMRRRAAVICGDLAEVRRYFQDGGLRG